MNLQSGDTIGIISPSWCGPETFPHVLEKGIENLKNMGFTIKEFPFTRKQGNPKEKAQDITQAFLDSDVEAIICSIGGDDVTFVLPLLDIELLKKHKKPIMGYSDSVALLSYLSFQGFECYNGPSIMAGFSHMHLYPKWFSYVEHVMKGQENALEPFAEYSNGYVDWSNGTIDVAQKHPHEGFKFLNELNGEGFLYGGCIEVIDWLRGTAYFPKLDFFTNVILFFETSEDKPSPEDVKYMLRAFGYMGVLQRIKGLLFGRARDYSTEEKAQLEEIILQVLKEFDVTIPVVANMDFGHTDPQLIIPYGKKVKISNNTIKFI